MSVEEYSSVLSGEGGQLNHNRCTVLLASPLRHLQMKYPELVLATLYVLRPIAAGLLAVTGSFLQLLGDNLWRLSTRERHRKSSTVGMNHKEWNSVDTEL